MPNLTPPPPPTPQEPTDPKSSNCQANASAKSSAGALSAVEQELEQAKTILKEAESKLAEMTELAKRTAADFQNFRRRSDEEKNQLAIFANLHFLQAIFPVIDNLNRAFAHIPEGLANEEWVKGVCAIEKQFTDTLASLGLQEIPCQPGIKFDPAFHEAVTQGPGEKDAILECLEKGYSWNGQVLRPAKVKVGNGESP